MCRNTRHDVMHKTVAGLVLAGGRSSRMGRDKALVRLPAGFGADGLTMLERACRLLGELTARVWVSCALGRPYAGYDCVFDDPGVAGAGAGILAGLRAAEAAGFAALLTLPCDLPLMDAPTLRRLLTAREDAPSGALATIFASAESGLLEPLAAVYETAARPFFTQVVAAGKQSLFDVIPAQRRRLVFYGPEEARPFFNLNSMDDLRGLAGYRGKVAGRTGGCHTGTDMNQRTIAILERQRQDLVVRVLKKHEEAEAGRLLTERILSGISDFFLLFDQDFRLAQSNRPLGPGDDATPETLFGPETGAEIRRRLAAEDCADFEAQLLLEDGPVPVRIRPMRHIGPDGRALFILLCSDLRELNRLGAQLREGQQQLVHSSRLASLGEMTAGIGHELTQPLGAILLLARNALKMLDNAQHAQSPPNQVRENLAMIVDCAEKAGAIITTMRGFGRKVEGAQVAVDVAALLRKLLRFLSGQFRIHDITVDLDLPDHPLPVLAVEVRLEQVFLNLAQNAIQALGGTAAPRLRVAARLEERLDLRSMNDQTCVVVDLRDNGRGMDEALQAKIFDPFFTTRSNGMGLGLSLVDRMVREFSGFVTVASRPGEGSCFSVWLPLHRDAEART